MPRRKWSISGYMRKWNFIKILFIYILYEIIQNSRPNYQILHDTYTTNSTLISKEVGMDRLQQKSHSNFNQERNDLLKTIEMLSKKKDWHNYTQITLELQRIGFGENGEAATLPSEERSREEEIFLENGYNGALSDKIALNRSVPDVRHPDCKKKQYLKSLPTVSVIIPFYNERLSALLRTVYSVVNRSPKQLIKEIFLVDDASTKDFLKDTLEKYLKDHLPKIKLLRHTTRIGLVGARLTGAKAATADVLIIIDAQCEVNVNWLPPLLEPIALDNHVAVSPCIDRINHDTLEYQKVDDGGRATFDLELWYQRPIFQPNILKKLPEPFETPLGAGCMIAISRKFFWELGGYDPGIKIWGADHIEISFKIWQCGGRILEVPCSRIGHIWRRHMPSLIDHDYKDFLSKNNRRVAEVWMDEYAEYLYINNPDLRDIDPGDLTEQKAIREKLKCKPFKWFLTQVAYDGHDYFPMEIPTPYFEGQIRPVLNPQLCVDGKNRSLDDRFVITPCSGSSEQKFQLSWHKDIRMKRKQIERFTPPYVCLDVPKLLKRRAPVKIFFCHDIGGNQQWTYDKKTQRIVHKSGNCLDYDKETLELFVSQCIQIAKTQQWIFDTINKK